jgi:hypothetical protein
MEIHLSKPGGQREGPFTLERINASLAQNKYRDTDYWAWYEGLESWVPLHEIPGVNQARQPAPKSHDTEHDKLSTQGDTEFLARKVTPSPAAGSNARTAPAAPVWSGLPVEALEHIFIFTDGEGPAAIASMDGARIMDEIMGASFDVVRGRVARDVFGRCNIPARLATEQDVPGSAWRAMSALKPELVHETRNGGYKVCVRIFDIESGQKMAAFLFYNKGKLP